MKPSKLTPHQALIGALRKEGKSYREIVEILRESHGLSVGRNTLHSFVKVRSKRPRKVYTMLEDPHVYAESGFLPKNLAQQTTQASQPIGSKPVEPPSRRRFQFGFSDRYNLTRLTPEEKAALEKKLDDEQKGEP